MSSRPILARQTVMAAEDMSDDITGPATNIQNISAPSYTVSWTSGSAGSFQVEACNDYVPSPPGVDNVQPESGSWVPVPLSYAVTSDGATDGSAQIDLTGIAALWIRLVFAFDSGSGGEATATLAGKVL